MPFTTNPYADVQQVYNALSLSSTAAAADGTWISELLVEAQAEIDAYLGFSFQTDGTTQSPSSRVYDGTDGYTLFIPGDRIISITQVLETTYNTYLSQQGIFVSGTTETIDITADCFLGPNNFGPYGYFLLKRKTLGATFVQGNQNYVVSGVFGRPSIPNDISRACVRTAVHWYQMRNTAYADMMQEQGGVRQHFKKGLPDDVCEILGRYYPRVFRG